MSQVQNSKQYDLEERTFLFARDTRDYIKHLPRTISNIEYGKQIIRSSGSIAAITSKQMKLLVKKTF